MMCLCRERCHCLVQDFCLVFDHSGVDAETRYKVSIELIDLEESVRCGRLTRKVMR